MGVSPLVHVGFNGVCFYKLIWTPFQNRPRTSESGAGARFCVVFVLQVIVVGLGNPWGQGKGSSSSSAGQSLTSLSPPQLPSPFLGRGTQTSEKQELKTW
jgi:hypothetical protein